MQEDVQMSKIYKIIVGGSVDLYLIYEINIEEYLTKNNMNLDAKVS